MKQKLGIKVFAPATVANVSVGYDILGFAIEGPGDQVIVRPGKEKGLVIKAIHHDNNLLPKDITKNTAGVSALNFLKDHGLEDEAIEMEIFKKMPFGSGMGSSAASAVAGVYGVSQYIKKVEKKELLKYCMLGEEAADGAMHGDNVAPSLFGGIVLMRDNRNFESLRLPVPKGLYCVLIHPNIEILTKDSRNVLSSKVSLNQHVQQSANLSGFIVGLFRSDFELIKRSLNDLIIEPQRAHLIPNFYECKKVAEDLGVLGFGISGAGPSMFALCFNSNIAKDVSEALTLTLKKNGIKSNVYTSLINQEGAFKY